MASHLLELDRLLLWCRAELEQRELRSYALDRWSVSISVMNPEAGPNVPLRNPVFADGRFRHQKLRLDNVSLSVVAVALRIFSAALRHRG
jgi:hypothetical protein